MGEQQAPGILGGMGPPTQEFTRTDGEWLTFPGLWERARTPSEDGEQEVQSFTLITCEPGLDAANYHDRQPVILERKHWERWLDPTADSKPALHAGSPPLTVRHIGGPLDPTRAHLARG